MVNWKKIVCNLAFCFSTMNTTNIYCLFYFILCTDPGFQVRGEGALKKNAPSGGRHENFWGISCEKSWFYAKTIIFFSNFRRSICLSLSISNSFPVYVHAVFHFASPLEIHNLYFGKHNKGDKSYKFMLQVANFHR